MENILNQEDIKFLQELGKELKEQDNRCTDKPLIWQIRDNKRVFGLDPLYSDDKVCIVEGCEGTTYYTIEECVEFIEEWHEDNGEEVPPEVYEMDDLSELCSYMNDMDEYDNYYYTGYEDTFELKNAFLTEKSAQLHLKKNGYHYKKGRVYCSHGWRNPELKRLLDIVEKFAKAEGK